MYFNAIYCLISKHFEDWLKKHSAIASCFFSVWKVDWHINWKNSKFTRPYAATLLYYYDMMLWRKQRERVSFSMACSNDCDQFATRSLQEKNFMILLYPVSHEVLKPFTVLTTYIAYRVCTSVRRFTRLNFIKIS